MPEGAHDNAHMHHIKKKKSNVEALMEGDDDNETKASDKTGGTLKRNLKD